MQFVVVVVLVAVVTVYVEEVVEDEVVELVVQVSHMTGHSIRSNAPIKALSQ